jgi:hypothetical protein
MRTTLLGFSLITLGFLSACSTTDPVTPAPVVVAPAAPAVVAAPAVAPAGTVVVAPAATAGATAVVATAIRPGKGRIESITPIASAAAGGTASTSTSSRIAVRMDDGTVQVLDTPAANLAVGERIELNRDGTMTR